MQDMAQVNRLTVAGPVYVISDCLPNVFAREGGGKNPLNLKSLSLCVYSQARKAWISVFKT